MTETTFQTGDEVRVTGPHTWTNGEPAFYVDELEPDPARVFIVLNPRDHDGDVYLRAKDDESGGAGYIAPTSLTLVSDMDGEPETSGGFEDVQLLTDDEILEGTIDTIDPDGALALVRHFLDAIDAEEITIRRTVRGRTCR